MIRTFLTASEPNPLWYWYLGQTGFDRMVHLLIRRLIRRRHVFLFPFFRPSYFVKLLGLATEVNIMLDIETDRIYVIYGKSRSNAL